jgi:hypothetical protein
MAFTKEITNIGAGSSTSGNLRVEGNLYIGDGTGDGPISIVEESDGGGGTSRKLTFGNIEMDYDGTSGATSMISFNAGSFGTARNWNLHQRKDSGNVGEFWLEYKNTSSGSWYQVIKVFPNAGDIALTVGDSGNIGIGTETFDGSVAKYIAIKNGTQPSAHTDNQIYIGSKDATTTNEATLSLFCEDDPETSTTWNMSQRMKIWINGTEYWIALDAV